MKEAFFGDNAVVHHHAGTNIESCVKIDSQGNAVNHFAKTVNSSAHL